MKDYAMEGTIDCISSHIRQDRINKSGKRWEDFVGYVSGIGENGRALDIYDALCKIAHGVISKRGMSRMSYKVLSDTQAVYNFDHWGRPDYWQEVNMVL